MPVYTCCEFECTHKELGRRLVKDLNDDGILCFFAGDIPTDQRFEMYGETKAALDRSQIFMPFVCQHFEGSRFCPKELAYANILEKLVMPVLLDPDFGSVKPGGLLTGLKLTDLSSSSKYKKKFPEFLETVNAMLSAAKLREAATAAAAAVNDDRSSTSSATGDQDDASEMAADEDQDAESETGDNDSCVTEMEDDQDDRASSQMQAASDDDENENEDGSEASD